MLRNMIGFEIAILSLAVATVSCDTLPNSIRNNAYLPPEPGYDYNKPNVPFAKPTIPAQRSSSLAGPTRATLAFPTRPPASPNRPNFPESGPKSTPAPAPRPTPGFPLSAPGPRPSPGGYPALGPKPTPGFPNYTGQPSANNGNTIGGDHHHHEPGMPFDFNYVVKEDAFGNDYSHNAISNGDVTRGEYRVQLPDGRMQIVRYTADWKNGFSAQVTYEGTPRFDAQQSGGNFQGY